MIKIPDFIYPKDEQGNNCCPRCKKVVSSCDCPTIEAPKPKQTRVKPKVRLDKSGRRGKCVTLVEQLPRNETYLKDLARMLKTKTGSGGTFYIEDEGGVVELQGDHKQMVEQFFSS